MKRLLTSLFTLCCLVACGKKEAPPASSSASPVAEAVATPAAAIKFTSIPNQAPDALKEKYGVFAKQLSSQLGVPVEYVPAKDYGEAVAMFSKGEVQFAWLGGLTALRALKAVPAARVIARGSSDAEAMSYFIANKASGLAVSSYFPAGIADKKFGFGPSLSTTGAMMPAWFIAKDSNKRPDQYFRINPSQSANHDETCEKVQTGELDAGAVDGEVYESRVKAGTTDSAIVQVIWKSSGFPNAAFVAHPDLDKANGAGFTDKLQTALVGLKDAAALSALPRTGLVSAKNEDLDELKSTATAMGSLP